MHSALVATDTGFQVADELALAVVGFGIALLAAIGALSHQRDRVFSASVIDFEHEHNCHVYEWPRSSRSSPSSW